MWRPHAEWGPPGGDFADVWRVPVPLPPEAAPGAAAILDVEERERMGAFARAEDRLRFLCARSALRRILSRYLDAAPEGLRFGRTGNGKPFLQAGSGGIAPPEFNVSHSGAWALIAVGDAPLGVDVEAIRPGTDWPRIAREFFPASEADGILALPPGAREEAFFRAWTRFEAGLKGRGGGLGEGAGNMNGTVTNRTEGREGGPEGNGWRVRNLPLDSGHASALAWSNVRAGIRYWSWNW